MLPVPGACTRRPRGSYRAQLWGLSHRRPLRDAHRRRPTLVVWRPNFLFSRPWTRGHAGEGRTWRQGGVAQRFNWTLSRVARRPSLSGTEPMIMICLYRGWSSRVVPSAPPMVAGLRGTGAQLVLLQVSAGTCATWRRGTRSASPRIATTPECRGAARGAWSRMFASCNTSCGVIGG